MPEVGLAGLPLDFPHSGSAVYARNLVPLLPTSAPDLSFRLYLRRACERLGTVPSSRLSTPFAPLAGRGPLWARADKLTWETVSLPVASAVHRDALIHSLYWASPVFSGAPVVVTIHDVIPLALEGYHRGRASALYSALMARTGKRAAAVITVSEHAKADIERLVRIPPERIFVTYEAAGAQFNPLPTPGERERLRRRYSVPERFLLYLGGAERRKNLETLVRAWHLVVRETGYDGAQLVIVADFPPPDALYPDIPDLVRELELVRHVKLLPYIAEPDKPAMYRMADGFCFPSLYEGFGLPPLEAMACGTPVLCSTSTSLPEVVGDAAWSLPACEPREWADAMRELLQSADLRENLRRRGIRRSRQFSWERTARETVDVYREVLLR